MSWNLKGQHFESCNTGATEKESLKDDDVD
jgi:hypothetical protein